MKAIEQHLEFLDPKQLCCIDITQLDRIEVLVEA